MTETRADSGFVRTVWTRMRRDRYAVTGLIIVTILVFVALFAPMIANDKPVVMRYEGRLYFPALSEQFPLSLVIAYPELHRADYRALRRDGHTRMWGPLIPHSPKLSSLPDKLMPPSPRHWLGTDELGRDVLARLVHGSRVSLSVGFVAVSITLLIGLFIGALAGYYGGIIDVFASRLIEVVMCFPVLFLILAVIAFLPPSIYTIMVVIGLTRWTSIARYSRGEFLRARNEEFAYAARALGASDRKIIFRHILPNSLAPVLVAATFGVANAILIEAALSFLGMGVPPPTPTWGGILTNALDYIDTAWWLALTPGIAIFMAVTAYNLLGEGLRDAIDPRHQAR